MFGVNLKKREGVEGLFADDEQGDGSCNRSEQRRIREGLRSPMSQANTQQILTVPSLDHLSGIESVWRNSADQSVGGAMVSIDGGELRQQGRQQIVATRIGEKRYTGEERVVNQYLVGSSVVETRVVGVERGAERQISVTEVAMGEEIIGERVIASGKGRRGRKVIREEVIERLIVVPETVQIEEWVDDEYDMEETVIEIAKKFQIEKIVETPEIEIVERIVEQIETIVREKIVEVPVIQTVERIIEIPIIQTMETIVEVPKVQYNDIPVEKIVEVVEFQNEDVIREIKRPEFREKIIEQKRLIAINETCSRLLPVPVEAETIVEFTIPHLRANYMKKKFPVFIPRFIEVPVSKRFLEAGVRFESDALKASLVDLISARPAVNLCELENVASQLKDIFDENNIYDGIIMSDNVKGNALAERIPRSDVVVAQRRPPTNVDQSTQLQIFAESSIDVEQFSLYPNLPIEVSDVHVGNYNGLNSSTSVVTYSSASFGITGQSSPTALTNCRVNSNTAPKNVPVLSQQHIVQF
eukprot:GHVH01002479.1.p1 GENE.GHVH01002479.1~~GHVH01002479.1.p1  ORF type:complete len:528 (+),score=94.46 GHVH01002479.1:230-1813(+)